ncbi:MAG: glycosyltransferase [Candidatus Binataceae bacterium]
MARRRGIHDYRAALIGEVTPRNAFVYSQLESSFAENGIYRCFMVPATANFPGNIESAISDALVMTGVRRYTPDAIHFTNLFGVDAPSLVAPSVDASACSEVVCATLYDLIPLVMSEMFLSDPVEDRCYRSCLDRLRGCDLILSISESSRRDAIGLLGIEEDRIVTIGADSSPTFRPFVSDSASLSEATRLKRRLGIERDFVFSCGGSGLQKNIDGLVSAFSALPAAMRGQRQLVISGILEQSHLERLRRLASTGGLRDNQLVFTGYVPDEDLACLYSQCELFVFPSLYEGFGLPILEAMRCGAAVIASNTSSMSELVDRSDALFDPAKPEEIAALMVRGLSDHGFRRSLAAHGIRRATDFSWEASADIAWQALIEAVARKRSLRSARNTALANGKRRRIAYVSPLPPAVSGVADYSAELIHALAQQVDLVLVTEQQEVASAFTDNFRTVRYEQLIASLDRFDTVLYNFGNSTFHAQMWDLLPKAPGVVILHDAFLSGLVNWMDDTGRRSGYFCQTLLADHGMNAARRGADPSQRLEVLMTKPMCGHVIRHATAVIVHSHFAADLLARAFPWLGVRAAVIPQIHSTNIRTAEREDQHEVANRVRIRERFDIAPDAFVVASFGYLTKTKRIEDLLRSFSHTRKENDMLIFVGDLPDIPFKKTVDELIEELGIAASVVVTGFVEPESYNAWLQAADGAVQLRQNTRGETSRSVLDCLAAGLPLIVNDYASLSELPDNIVVKVPSEPEPSDISCAIDALRRETGRRRELRRLSQRYAREHHSPAKVTGMILSTLDYAVERPADLAGDHEISEVARIVGRIGRKVTDESLRAIAESIALGRRATFPSRLFADVSYIVKFDYGSGIQRVVRNILANLMNFDETPRTVIPTTFTSEGDLRWATEMESERILAVQGLADRIALTIEPGPGDVLLLIDSNWENVDIYAPAVERWRRRGARVYSVVYDLLPIQFPDFFDAVACKVHRHWLELSARISDGIIGISRSVADEVITFLTEGGFHREGDPLRIGWFHHGSDFAPSALEVSLSDEVTRLWAPGSFPYVLMIGTIEPRKNHWLAIRAIEALVASGENIRLVIAGRVGWEVDQLASFLKQRSFSAGPIVFLEHPSDAEVDALYRHALALAMPSYGEGFGLPIVEAAQRDVPAIVSDIPVFREIGGEGTLFIDPHDVEAFAHAIRKLMDETLDMRHRRASSVRRQSWSDSAHQLVKIIYGGNWYRNAE